MSTASITAALIPKPLNRIRKVRMLEGFSVALLAKRLGLDAATVQKQEIPDSDLTVSELGRYAFVLNVPAGELLCDEYRMVDSPIRDRAKFVQLAKTVESLAELASQPRHIRLINQLRGYVEELMPELKGFSEPWNVQGRKRTLDEFGKTGTDVYPSTVRMWP